MKFFHLYREEYFEGLVKNNLINEDTGLKIMNIFRMPDKGHFDNIAKVGGKLHSIIKDENYPFYIDRIAGGCTYYHYTYNKSLIHEYADMLGEWFLGFQHHESASNRINSDWARILKAMNGEKGPYDAKELEAACRNESVKTLSGEVLYILSQGFPKDYAPLTYPENYKDQLSDFVRMYKARMDDCDGFILPCDSYYLLTKLHDEMGMRSFMPEVGWQIPLMREEIALARGIAEGSGKLWGTYYEPWFFNEEMEYSVPRYNEDIDNDFYHNKDTNLYAMLKSTPNHGSSRLLQERIYYYSLMAGADYMSEEWGMNCSYYDKSDRFELSPYGRVKKEFIEFAREFKTVKAHAPIAIVLPLSYKCVEIYDPTMGSKLSRGEYMARKLPEWETNYFGHIQDTLDFIYERNEKTYGNEGHVMTNSRFGDLFDIIYEDASDDTLSKYDALIDTTPDGAITKALGGKYRIFESTDFKKLELDIKAFAEEILPVTVDSLHWLISKDKEDRRFLTIFNNEGNYRNNLKGDSIIREADRAVTVSFKEATSLKVIKTGSYDVEIEKIDDKTYRVMIPATRFAIFEF